jgi:hypothetical protein
MFQRSVTPWRGTNRRLGAKPTLTISVIWTCRTQPSPFHGPQVAHLRRFLKNLSGSDTKFVARIRNTLILGLVSFVFSIDATPFRCAHYPALSVCDSWAAQDDWFTLMTENWENTLEILKVADFDKYKAIRSLDSKSLQRDAVREVIERFRPSPCK